MSALEVLARPRAYNNNFHVVVDVPVYLLGVKPCLECLRARLERAFVKQLAALSVVHQEKIHPVILARLSSVA